MNIEETWVCVDGHGDERIFPNKPHRNFSNMNLDILWGQRWTTDSIENNFKRGILLPKGTIKHLVGKEMTYNAERIKL